MAKTSTTCSHGLSDDCDIVKRVMIDDYEAGQQTVIFHYLCKKHGRKGSFLALLDTPAGPKKVQ